MKPELNQTQAIYPPEDPKPKVCVTTTIVALRVPIDNRQLFASEGATLSGINQ